MPPHAFAKTSPVPGGTTPSRHCPLIFMKCLRHLLALLRSPGLCRVRVLLRGGHRDLRLVPSPQLSVGDLHVTSLCALFPLGTGVAHICTLRLHCLVVCRMEPLARSGPESLIAEDNCQAASTHCPLWCWIELRASVCLFTLNLCLAVSDSAQHSCSAALVTVTQHVSLMRDSFPTWLGVVGYTCHPSTGSLRQVGCQE